MMKLHRLYEKWRCFIGKGIDIWSKNPYPSNVLSNLHDNPFEFDGVKCGSMEGFLQSLKYKDAVKQKEVCAMAGMDAKDMTNADWQANQIIWWKGQEINRQSKTFQELVMRAYQAMMSQNETFRMALLSTKGKTLYHSKGNNNPYKTILTRDEFCKILMELRSIVKTSPLTSEESTNTQDYFDKALNLEESGNLKEAYEYYRKAAEEGLSDAMFKLYDLYLNKGFHAKENNNMLELALSGKPVMPWDVTSQKVNDVESGIYWLRRAAEAGHIEACCIYGHRLCDEKDFAKTLTNDLNDCPFRLERFVKAQEQMYDIALEEIEDGQKRSHWIWYVFPQLAVLGHSHNAKHYGLSGYDEAEAYLKHPILGYRLREITQALLLHKDLTAEEILGGIDAMKVKSCMTLFAEVSPDDIFDEVLKVFYNGTSDKLTLELM